MVNEKIHPSTERSKESYVFSAWYLAEKKSYLRNGNCSTETYVSLRSDFKKSMGSWIAYSFGVSERRKQYYNESTFFQHRIALGEGDWRERKP